MTNFQIVRSRFDLIIFSNLFCCRCDNPLPEPVQNTTNSSLPESSSDSESLPDSATIDDTESTSSESSPTLPQESCRNSIPIPMRGSSIDPPLFSGMELCENLSVRRVSEEQCILNLDHQSRLNTQLDPSCDSDSDCIAKSNGKCVEDAGEDGDMMCIYPCERDSDCSSGESCLCGYKVDVTTKRFDYFFPLYGSYGGSCLRSTCQTSADCGGKDCVVNARGCGYATSLHCRTDEDECHGHTDCMGEKNRACRFDASQQRWRCQIRLSSDDC